MLSLFRAALPPLCAAAGALFTLVPALARPDPADPKAPVPAAVYVSPLRTYQGLAEVAVAPWRQTNERLRPGHVAMPASAASAPMPSHDGHAGHHQH